MNIEKLLNNEYKECLNNLKPEIIILPSSKKINIWKIIFLPLQGIFSDQIISCYILFEEFPLKIPKILFNFGLFHPLIDPETFKFDPSIKFKEWNINIKVFSLINFIYDSLIDIPFSSNFDFPNKEANYLKFKDMELFKKKALLSINEQKEDKDFDIPNHWDEYKEKITLILNNSNKK